MLPLLIASLLLISATVTAQPTIDINAPPLPQAYTVQPAPPQFWIPCGAVSAPLPVTCTAADGTIVDMRNETFYVLYSANPDIDGGACSYTGSQARPVQRYPLGNPSDVNAALGIPNLVLLGGRIVGNISTTLDGFINASVGGYCNSAAIDLKNVNPANTHMTIDSVRIDRVWDAIRLNKEPCYGPDNGGTPPYPTGPPTGCNHVIKNTWVSNARDDAIEWDLGYAGITVRDSLFDGVFSFISMAPGGTIHNHSSDIILIDNTLIRLQGWPYGELQPDGITRIVKPYHIAPFKTGLDSTRLKMPKIEIHDSVINASVYIPNNTSNIATGTHWAYFFRQVGKNASDIFDPTRCSNNVFLWTSDDPLPATMVAEMPTSCFTTLTGADARWYWDFRKSDWIDNHTTLAGIPPGLENLPGMPKPVERIAGDP